VTLREGWGEPYNPPEKKHQVKESPRSRKKRLSRRNAGSKHEKGKWQLVRGLEGGGQKI